MKVEISFEVNNLKEINTIKYFREKMTELKLDNLQTRVYSNKNYDSLIDKKEAALYCGVGLKSFYHACKTDAFLIDRLRWHDNKFFHVNDLLIWASLNDHVQPWMKDIPYYESLISKYKENPKKMGRL